MDTTFDRMYYDKGDYIGGVDESGISDIAGPIVAACVVLPKIIDPSKHDLSIFEINESKSVPERHRKRQAEIIFETAIGLGIGTVEPREVDYLRIDRARNLAMARAVKNCQTTRKEIIVPDFIIVDGAEKIRHVNTEQLAKPSGDKISLCVAAASIIAKVYRDSIMIGLHNKYPYYAWNKNKGFPSEDHLKGLDEKGIVLNVHRLSSWVFVGKGNKGPATWNVEERRTMWRKKTHNRLYFDGKEKMDE
jgi:ribonuclease HII